MKAILIFFIESIMLIYINGYVYSQEIFSKSDADQTKTITKKHYKIDLEVGASRYFFYNKLQTPSGLTVIGQYNHIVSELNYPLNVFMLYGNINLIISDYILIQFKFQKNIGPLWGKHEDSDFLSTGQKWSYGTGKAYLIDGIIPDVDLLFKIFNQKFISLNFGLGFLYEYFNYRVSNLRQYSYEVLWIPNSFTGIIWYPLKFDTYEVNYYNLYIEFMPEVNLIKNKLLIAFGVRWCPYLVDNYINNHILRSFRLYGQSLYGTSVMPIIKLKYIFENKIFVSVGIDYLFQKSWGGTKTSYYWSYFSYYLFSDQSSLFQNLYSTSGNIATIIESSQLSAHAGIGYRFEI